MKTKRLVVVFAAIVVLAAVALAGCGQKATPTPSMVTEEPKIDRVTVSGGSGGVLDYTDKTVSVAVFALEEAPSENPSEYEIGPTPEVGWEYEHKGGEKGKLVLKLEDGHLVFSKNGEVVARSRVTFPSGQGFKVIFATGGLSIYHVWLT